MSHCFEWGAGHSSEIMNGHEKVKTIDSVENDLHYLDMVRAKFSVGRVNFLFENDERFYPRVKGDHAPYDFIFIDGKLRELCLENCRMILKKNGIVMVHDAEREEYAPHMVKFKYQFNTDEGHTAVLTDDDNRASEISRILSSNSIR
jgi:predicted O-methyltransferase YrrM